jgi:hypothetical protein
MKTLSVVALLCGFLTCQFGLTDLAMAEDPYVIKISGNLQGLTYDKWRDRVYLSNSTLNQVLTYDVGTGTWLDPISVGSLPEGLDITPDGSRLYVLNAGAPKVSVIDLTLDTPVETDRITLEGVTPVPGEVVGNKWKFCSDGTAFFNMGGEYYAAGYHFDPVTNNVTPLDIAGWGHIYTTWDRMTVVMGKHNKAVVYDSIARTFEPEGTLDGFGPNWWDWVVAIAISNDKSIRAATHNGQTVLFDSQWNIEGTIPGASDVDDDYDGLVFSPLDDILYRAVRTDGYQVEKIDVDMMFVYDSILLPERLAMRDGGDMKINWWGDYLYAISESGLMVIPTSETPIPEIAEISVFPESLQFGDVSVGSSSNATLKIYNTGTANLTINEISITGTGASEFSVVENGCTGQTLPWLGRCEVNMVFSPTSTGLKSANLSILSNDPNTPALDVPLSGTGLPDSDGDGLTDNLEVLLGTDPSDLDTDDDGLSDGDEDANHNGIVNENETDPTKADTDGDGIQDGTELGITEPVPDPDGEGPLLGTDTEVFVPDADPATSTDPLDADTDLDEIWDGFEDANHNGMVDSGETDPNDADTDDDGILDGVEDANQNGIVDSGETDPLDGDTDDDGILDGVEDANHNGMVDSGETDPCNVDTDGEGVQDGTELGYTLADIGPDTDTSIFQPDLDPTTTTDALNPDTDGDGANDGEEDINHNGRIDPGETDPNYRALDIFGLEVDNVRTYQGTYKQGGSYPSEERVTAIDQTTFPVTTYVAESRENGILDAKDWYEKASGQLMLWGELLDGNMLKFSNGLVVAWYPMEVNDHEYSSATTELYGYVFNVSMAVDVLSKEPVALSFDTFQAYKLRYQLRMWNYALGFDESDTFYHWVVPYVGMLKYEDAESLEELTAFAIGGGTITQDSDADDDGLKDYQELIVYNTDPQNTDTDGDGLTDGDEVNTYGTDPNSADTDNDGITDSDELALGTDPTESDTDADGLTDGDEVNTYGTDPKIADTDNDDLKDGDEVNIHGTDPLNSDTDGDEMPDGWEVTYGLNPLSDDADEDLDGDGVSNIDEYNAGSNPNNKNPAKPELIAPEDGATNVTLTPTLETNPFSDPENDGHARTEWQISTQLDDFSDDLLVFKAESDLALTALTVTDYILEENASYYWRVRFTDDEGAKSGWSDVYGFETGASTVVDQNPANGIPDSQDLDPGDPVQSELDLDDNGTFDINELSDTWKCLNTEAGDGHVGVEVSPGYILNAVESVDPASISDTVNRPDTLPHTLVSFSVTVPNAGDSVDITVYLSGTLPTNTQWYTWNAGSGWQQFLATFSQTGAGDTKVVFTKTDGGTGDADGLANGIIVDPSGPGIVTAPAPGPAPAAAGGGGGGGCFIAAAGELPE